MGVPPTLRDPIQDIFARGGVSGAVAAATDWSNTSLGPTQGWPQSLKTTLGILFQSRHPMFLWWGPELIQFYNDAYLPSFGKGKHPTAMGQRGKECWPEIWPIIFPQIQDVMERARASWNENQLVPIFRNGKIEDVYWTYGYSPVFDERGAVAGTLVVCTETTRDVLGRQEIERAHHEAQAARARLNALFENAPAFVCTLTGPDHVFQMANQHYRRLVGDKRELEGKSLAQALPEIVGQGFLDLLNRVYTTGVPFVGHETSVRLDKQGSGVLEDAFLDFVYEPRFNAQGSVEGVDVFGFDVTEQVRARRRVEALMAQLKVEGQRKDEFLATLAHELRNPMAAISTSLAMMERAGTDPVKNAKYREIAERQMRNLVRLVDDLLDVSRITRGTVELRKEEVDLGAVVANAVAATRAALESRGHELSVSVSGGRFNLLADSTRLEQVVTNLLTNAAKYTDPGGTVSVRLASETVNGEAHAVLRVKDTGRGIPAAMLDKVFDLFVQVDQTIDRTKGGLGLGLTLVKRLVELHGGTVEALSAGPGQGSEFVVRLPNSPQSSAEDSSEAHEAGLPEASTDLRRIVVVEDSDDVREALSEILVEMGHHVDVAANGTDGVRKLLEIRPDVALVDVGLPGIDGYEVARLVRAQLDTLRPYLVALTGYGGPDAQQQALSAGFDAHLTKPVSLTELLQVVARRL